MNLNNTEIADDDDIFSSILNGIKYFLIAISDLWRTVEKIEIVFLNSNRNEKNELYAEEIKTFLDVISESESLRESMRIIKFDSYAIEIMIGLISCFHSLTELNIVDCIYIEGEYFPLIKANWLKKLNLSGSHQIWWEHIQFIVNNNFETLRSLKLDGENMEGGKLTEIIKKINVLEELWIYYGNLVSSDLLHALIKHSRTLKKLIIRKNENFLEQDFLFFF